MTMPNTVPITIAAIAPGAKPSGGVQLQTQHVFWQGVSVVSLRRSHLTVSVSKEQVSRGFRSFPLQGSVVWAQLSFRG